MAFLTLKENTNLSTVCYKWYKCYKTIWYTNTYFNTMNCNSYSEEELRKIFQKSKLPMHRAISDFFTGKKVATVLSRSFIEAKQSSKECEGALLHSLKVRPQKAALAPILFDNDIIKICSESVKSMMYLSLNSCGFIGEASFFAIKNLKNLQLLEITNNPKLLDSHVGEILKDCTSLAT
jgi:hypothetical protein